jgi:hypothetical protein
MRTTALILFVLLLAHPERPAQQSERKFAEIHSFGNFITSEGVWVPDNWTKRTELPPSLTELECYKHGGKEIVGTEAYCMEATAQIVDGLPGINVLYHPVKEWNAKRIVAADSSTAQLPICTWTQITINLRERSITSTDKRKQGKGPEGLANTCLDLPLTQTYHLIDQLEATTMRQSKHPN